jgi:phosphohistidine swiveling domain-containing protein
VKHICWLHERAARDRSVAGGKGASLAALRAAGFDVPDGFVITTRAFRDAGGGALPAALAAELARAYRRLGGRVAVRSSLVAEDGADHSFAGQLESCLNVEGEDACLAAVHRVYQSAQRASFAQYAARAAGGGEAARADLNLAVIVQRMIAPRAAGAAFSVDPVTGERHVVIEAVPGVADRLMSGTAVPSLFVLDTRGALVAADRRGVDLDVLPDEAVMRLASVIRDVADLAGTPQDVEWAWAGDAVTLLQARPITGLASSHVYSRRLVGDMSPGLIKPLLWSTHSRSMTRRVFERIFTELAGPIDLDFARLVRRVYSRMYADMTLFGQLLARTGLPANFFESLTRDDRPGRPRVSRARLLPKLPRIAVFLWRYARAGRALEAFFERHETALRPFREADWSAVPLDTLLPESARLQDAHGDTQWHMFVGAMNMTVRNKLLQRFARRHAPGVAPGDLVRGLPRLNTLEPNVVLRHIAAGAVRLDDGAALLLQSGDDRQIRQALAASEAGRSLARAMDLYLARFGHLAANGPDFTEPRWSEDPTLAWRALARMLDTTDPGLPAQAAAAAGDRARAAVRSRIRPLARLWFDRLVATTAAYMDRRERLSAAMTTDAFEARRLFLAIGDRLAQRGDLQTRDDVFMLYYDELRALVEQRMDALTARARIGARRAEMAADAGIVPPETFWGEHPPLDAPGADPGEVLAGIPGSAGVIRGYACVVLDPAAAPASLSKQHVLVVPFTDVGWMPLFASVGGVVAECGGQLSHTAIIAREYGLPTVVGIANATRVIRHGQAVTVDGTRGLVYLKHLRPAAPEEEP